MTTPRLNGNNDSKNFWCELASASMFRAGTRASISGRMDGRFDDYASHRCNGMHAQQEQYGKQESTTEPVPSTPAPLTPATMPPRRSKAPPSGTGAKEKEAKETAAPSGKLPGSSPSSLSPSSPASCLKPLSTTAMALLVLLYVAK